MGCHALLHLLWVSDSYSWIKQGSLPTTEAGTRTSELISGPMKTQRSGNHGDPAFVATSSFQGRQVAMPRAPHPCLAVRPGKRGVQCWTVVVTVLSSLGWSMVLSLHFWVPTPHICPNWPPSLTGQPEASQHPFQKSHFCSFQLKPQLRICSFPKSDQQNLNVNSKLRESQVWIRESQKL